MSGQLHQLLGSHIISLSRLLLNLLMPQVFIKAGNGAAPQGGSSFPPFKISIRAHEGLAALPLEGGLRGNPQEYAVLMLTRTGQGALMTKTAAKGTQGTKSAGTGPLHLSSSEKTAFKCSIVARQSEADGGGEGPTAPGSHCTPLNA